MISRESVQSLWRWTSSVPRLAVEIWQSAPRYCLVLLSARIINAILPVVALAIGGKLIDSINKAQVVHGTPRTVWLLLLGEGITVVGMLTLTRVIGHADLVLSDRFSLQMLRKLMEHCSSLDLESFESPTFQDRLDRARNQIAAQVSLVKNFLAVLQQMIGIACVFVSAAVVSPALVIFQIIGVVPIAWSEAYFAQVRYKLNHSHTPTRRLLGYYLALVTNLGTIKEIKLFAASSHVIAQYVNLAEEKNNVDAKVSSSQMVLGIVLLFISACIYYTLYYRLIWMCLDGTISLGRLVFVAGLLQQIRGQFTSLFTNLSQSLDNLMHASDVREFFDEIPKIERSAQRSNAIADKRRGIEFCNVSFAYSGSQNPVVRNVSFRIAPGEKIALVGHNGSGKTTLVKLLMRLYDPTGGKILIDGIDIKEYSPQQLRAMVSAVFQDYVKYDLPANFNIGIGEIDEIGEIAMLRKAAANAKIADLIENMPSGYDQMLGRRFRDGIELSGGQWQRVALARAYMRHARIVILDEPTAAADPRAEFEMYRDVVSSLEDKMGILISHRFSTVRIADRIVLLEKGEIRESGTHAELLAAGGEYASLFELQAQGYR